MLPYARAASSRCSTGVSSSFVWLRPFVEDEKIITVGTRRAISAASCSGPLGSWRSLPATSRQAAGGRRHELVVERDRIDAPEVLELDRAALRLGGALGGRAHLGEHLGELAGSEVALIDEQRRAARNRGDDTRLAARVAHRADAVVPARDLAQLEREARGREERVAPLVDRRRPGVRGLPVEDDAVTLDADGAEHRADGETLALEHRALLDVQLEVGADVLEPRAGLVRAVELDAVLAHDVLEPLATGVDEIAHGIRIEGAGDRRAAEQAAPEARALLVGPVDQRDA